MLTKIYTFLIIFFLFFSIACTNNYNFEFLFPEITQRWYFSSPSFLCKDISGNIYISDYSKNNVSVFTSTGGFLYTFGQTGISEGEFSGPAGIACDASGNVYVVDSQNFRIQVFTSTGGYKFHWGVKGSEEGKFEAPYGIAIDTQGYVYVTDSLNYRVQVFTSTGGYLYFWGNEGVADAEFKKPSGICTDIKGRISVTDQVNNNVQVFTSTGGFLFKWGLSGSAEGEFNMPSGIFSDDTGFFYVSDSLNHRIQVFTSTGGYIKQWGVLGSSISALNSPCGLCLNKDGNIVIADKENQRVQVFSKDGNYIDCWASWGDETGKLHLPYGVAIDGEGKLFISDTLNNRIQVFTSTGGYLYAWGTRGTYDGEFISPKGISLDDNNNVYIVDSGNSRVQVFDRYGNFLKKWGSFGSADGLFMSPCDIVCGPDNLIYVSDSLNNRIQVFTSTGGFIKKFGSGPSNQPGFFNIPSGIDIDSKGRVFVCDSFNSRIEVFSSTGSFLYSWGSYGHSDVELNKPEGIKISGYVYVVDSGNNKVKIFTSTGGFIGTVGTAGSGDGQFYFPSSLSFDSNSSMYVCDTYNNRIQKFSPLPYIKGYVLDISSEGIKDVTVKLTGDSSAEFQTDESGYYEFFFSSFGGNYRITPVKKDVDFIPHYRDYSPFSLSLSEQNFTGIEYGYIQGIIKLSETDVPVEGAVIDVLKEDQILFSTTSDGSGMYSLKVIKGVYVLKVSSTGFSSEYLTDISVVYGSTLTLNIELNPQKGYITGKVFKADKTTTLGSALIEVIKLDTIIDTVESDINGDFYIELSTGVYDLRCSLPDYVGDFKQNINVIYDSTTTINFFLIEKGSITGIVKSYNNVYLEGAEVGVYDSGKEIYVTRTDSSGNYTVTVATGIYTLSAHYPGYAISWIKDVNVSFRSSSTVNFSLFPAGYISGYVKSNIDGSAIEGALVEVITGNEIVKKVFTDENGYYYIEITTGSYRLKVENYSYLGSAVDVCVTEAQTEYIDFYLIPAGYIIGVVISTEVPFSGEIIVSTYSINPLGGYLPVENADIEILEMDSDIIKFTGVTDLNGYYCVKTATGTYTVRAVKKWFITGSTGPVIVVAGDIAVCNFSLIRIKEKCKISVNIKEISGVPVESVTLLLSGEQKVKNYTNKNGYCEFSDITGDTIYTVIPGKTNYVFSPSSITFYLIDDSVLDFTAVYTFLQSPELIDIPAGVRDLPVRVSMSEEGKIKVIAKENPDKKDKIRGTINPDNKENFVIVFNPGVSVSEYLNREYTVKIYSLQGELIEKFIKIPRFSDDLFIEYCPVNFPSGVYILSVEGPGIKTYSKFIVAR